LTSVRAIVEWGAEHQQLVDSVEALDELLDAITAEGGAQMAQVTRESAGTLGIVLAAERSFLHHVPVTVEPPYFASVGDQERDETLAFMVGGAQQSEVPWAATIAVELARDAMRVFVAEGALSSTVRWVET
jgi:hypothetical protein